MSSKERDIHFLMDLMDDDNDQSAAMAMAELLKSGNPDIVNQRLCELQETRSLRMRRRVHQLQSAIGARFLRAILENDLRSGELPLLDGAIRLHLYWFDNDTYGNVATQWNDLLDDMLDCVRNGIMDFSEFMVNQGFIMPASRDEMEPEYFCIGCVIDDMPGSDLMLSLIASQLSAGTPFALRIIRSGLNFGVMDSKGNKMFPSDSWRVVPAKRGAAVQPVKDSAVLRMIASALFQCALTSDGFRYLYTIGSALAASTGEDNLDFLPYPYNTETEKQS